jgi:VWFA-related protein
VSVLRRGSPVTDLTAEEFVVEEDDQQREVLRVEPATTPMQIAILVDDSYGLTDSLSHVRTGLSELIDALPDGHQMAFITFGDHQRMIVDYTRDKSRLKAAAGEFVQFSDTSSYLTNALVDTAFDLRRRGATRPIIILVTSEGASSATARLRAGRQGGVVTSPRGGEGLGYERVLTVLRETLVAVHSLVVRDVGVPLFATGPDRSAGTRGLLNDSVGDRDRAVVLSKLPSVTGGGREELGTTSALAKLLTGIADEIANQYRVTYARPAGLIPPDEIDVSVTRRGMRVRSTPAHPLVRLVQ